MLKEFRITNFKSINETQVFSMEACPKNIISEHPGHVIESNGERLLKVSSFYGPNGGGKSNLINAFSFLSKLVTNEEMYLEFGENNPFIPSLFCKKKETTFELFIVNDNYEIGYSISFDASKTKEIHEERQRRYFYGERLIDVDILSEEFVCRSLSEKSFKTLFSRKRETITSSIPFIKEMDIISNRKSLASGVSFLGYIAQTFDLSDNVRDLRPIYDLYKEVSSAVFLSRESRLSIPLFISDKTAKKMKQFIPKVVEMLNKIDIRVKDLVFEPNREKIYILHVKRSRPDGGETSLPITNESSGTRKLISILFDITSTKSSVIYMADDFDSFLHPKLVKCIIDLFTSSENTNKQLIMNSHDVVNMNNKTFRRDEIWFAYRDENYSTKYLPLSNIVNYKGEMIRKDAVYSKQYLEGRFGADPFIRKGLSWSDD